MEHREERECTDLKAGQVSRKKRLEKKLVVRMEEVNEEKEC